MAYRPITISIFIFIFISIGLYQIYIRTNRGPQEHHLTVDRKWIGVIDMDANHGVNTTGILRGEDVVLLVDHRNYLFQQLAQRLPEAQKYNVSRLFDIALFDHNNDGLITALDPIFKHLYVLVVHESGQYYLVRHVSLAGIRAFRVRHLSPYGNHTAIMSDGTERTLYETHSRLTPIKP